MTLPNIIQHTPYHLTFSPTTISFPNPKTCSVLLPDNQDSSSFLTSQYLSGSISKRSTTLPAFFDFKSAFIMLTSCSVFSITLYESLKNGDPISLEEVSSVRFASPLKKKSSSPFSDTACASSFKSSAFMIDGSGS